MTTLCTPEDQLEWDALTLRKNALTLELRDIERSMANLAAKTFEHLLRTGEWKVEPDGPFGRIVPANKQAAEQVEEIVGFALALGHHDSFVVSDGDVHIQGRVNDGDLYLALWPRRIREPHNIAEVTEGFKTLRVNVDLSAFAADLHKHALMKAKRDLADARSLVHQLEAKEPK